MPVVLAVDDEPDILRLVTSVLSRAGFVVLAAGDYDEAAGLLKTREVDVVLTDKNLPLRSGLDVVHEARRIRPGVGVVLMTAHPGVDAIRKLEPDAYLAKPFRALSDVVEAVNRALESIKRRALQDNLALTESGLRDAHKGD